MRLADGSRLAAPRPRSGSPNCGWQRLLQAPLSSQLGRPPARAGGSDSTQESRLASLGRLSPHERECSRRAVDQARPTGLHIPRQRE